MMIVFYYIGWLGDGWTAVLLRGLKGPGHRYLGVFIPVGPMVLCAQMVRSGAPTYGIWYNSGGGLRGTSCSTVRRKA